MEKEPRQYDNIIITYFYYVEIEVSWSWLMNLEKEF